jgi:hypothetical protein
VNAVEPVASDLARATARRSVAAVAVAWLATFAILLAVCAALLGPPPARDDAPALERRGRDLMPNNSNARPSGDAMVVANRREAPLTLLAISQQPVRTADYARVIVDAEPVPRGVEIALIWVRAGEPGRAHDVAIGLDAQRRVRPTMLDRDAEWRGDVTLLALGIKGPMETAWTVRSLRVEPPSLTGTLSDIVGGWTAFERWDGRSINVLFGGADEQRAWLPPLAFAASLAAAALAAWRARRRGQRVHPALVLLPFVAGWLVVDLRWQWNLVTQARTTVAEFGGRDWAERHAQMEDGDLFRFVQQAVAKLPREPVRIFVNSDYEYFRRRAGYHLYPHNVLSYDWGEPSLLKPGEYLLLYQMADVRYDAGQRKLLWANGRQLAVTPLIAQRGAGLFVVRPEGAG